MILQTKGCLFLSLECFACFGYTQNAHRVVAKQFPAIIEQVKFTSNVVLEMEKAGFERTYVVWRKHKADLLFVPVKPGDRLELGTVEAVNKSTCLSRVGQFCDDT